MAGTDDVRYTRNTRRLFWWLTAAAAVVFGAFGALLLSSGQAAAQPISVPGIGSIEVPIEIQTPAGIPETVPAVEPVAPKVAPHSEAAVTGIVNQLQTVIPGIDFRALLPQVPDVPRADLVPDTLAPPAPAATPEKTRGERAVEAAESKIGAAYGYGAAGPDSFDCSGLVQWSYGQAGVDVPRTSYEQLSAGTPVDMDELQPGDMVSFYGGGHSALYAGDGKVIHAGTSSTGVQLTDLSEMPASGARRF
ncbi:C40 family peptidase [Nocardia wallacei]|uniref:C40 family peptidase n=1 Tax=Nocardia wallacei TaxID=480035 RepID=UPI00245661BB|nr:C40 family peptidase [Nocardia wallacei]